jgi:hypothetical protein
MRVRSEGGYIFIYLHRPLWAACRGETAGPASS